MAKIVLATGDVACIDAVRATIESMGHEAFVLESGVDVVGEVLEQEAALAVIDETMATFDGYEVARMLREEPKIPEAFPILLLVGMRTKSRKLGKAGVSACFVKGQNSTDLSALLIKLLGDEAGVADFLKK